MGRLTFLAAVAVVLLSSPSASAQPLSGLARLVPGAAAVSDRGAQTELTLGLSLGVPYRVFTLDAPRRLVIDFREVDWSGFDGRAFDRSARVAAVHTGRYGRNWSRMVLELDRPLRLVSAAAAPAGGGAVTLRLLFEETTAQDFAARSHPPADAVPAIAAPAAASDLDGVGDGPLVVVLDPGHGGVDPGAESGDVVEADIVLAFARRLREALVRSGGFRVVMTRDGDDFVPLERRVSIARRAGADVFLSLHADALAQGRASGATIYTLSETASDIASQKLAERHERTDLLAGVDLSAQDDVVAGVLMDLARTETAHRSERLAEALVGGLAEAVGVHRRPHLHAGFSVLKAPDIPSALVELGFLSSPRDRSNLADPDWQKRAAEGLRDGLAAWAAADAAEAPLMRR